MQWLVVECKVLSGPSGCTTLGDEVVWLPVLLLVTMRYQIEMEFIETEDTISLNAMVN